MSREFGAAVLALVLITAHTAFADGVQPIDTTQTDAASLPPLAPGQAAGIRAAENGPDINKVAIVAGIGLAALAIYFVKGTNYKVRSASGTH